MELTAPHPNSRRLQRATGGRMLAGVAAGLAEYLDFDVTVIRLVLVVLALVGGVGIPLYVAAWLLVPEEGSDTPLATELLERLRTR